MAYKGFYNPKNPQKVLNETLHYRSLWELRVMKELDLNPSILKWGYECVAIPYFSQIDAKWHKYFPDFMIQCKCNDGSIKIKMLEIKPKHQTSEPKPPKRKTRKSSNRFLREQATFYINQSKWQAAKEYCDQRKWIFKIITEQDLFT